MRFVRMLQSRLEPLFYAERMAKGWQALHTGSEQVRRRAGHAIRGLGRT